MTDHVKIYGIKPRIQYVADGTLTVYEFPFAIFSTSDIDVYFGDTLQDTSTYTVSEARHSDGGSVTFASAPTSGTIITIVRNLSIERTSDFQEGSTLRAKVLNDELDYQVACQQQIAENLNRSMVLPPYAADSDLDLTLPLPSAGKAIVWNADGTNLENSTVEVNALESTLNGYKTAAESAAATSINNSSVATTQAGIATTKAEEATTAANQLNGLRTNCITELHPNVNLVLSDGVLTLKAGSKVYVCDGNLTEATSNTDRTITYSSNGKKIVMAVANDSGIVESIGLSPLDRAVSGSDPSGSSEGYDYFFNTTNNKIYVSVNNAWSERSNRCLPLGIVTVSNGAISSIDQVFDNFGYIGSTVFVLPHIKGFIPTGRNTDGSLNSTEFTVNNILMHTVSGTFSNKSLLVNGTGVLVEENTYDDTKNYNSNSSYCEIGTLSATNNIIINLNCKTTFHALDHYDFLKLKNNVDAKQSIYVSGSKYVCFDDGTLIQWGSLNSGQTAVTFATPFKDTDYSFVVDAYYNSSSQVAYYNRTTTGCSIYPNRNDYATTYIAIGKWK